MKILSFDQAANVSGWSYWEDEVPVKWGTVEPSPKTLRGGQRLHSLRKQFEDLIKEFNPDMILIENPVGGEEDKRGGPENNWKTMQTLCQVQGVLLEVIAAHRKKVEIISPSSELAFTPACSRALRATGSFRLEMLPVTKVR